MWSKAGTHRDDPSKSHYNGIQFWMLVKRFRVNLMIERVEVMPELEDSCFS